MKPRVFVGSSSEGLKIAYALQENLERDAEVTVWNQDVLRPSDFILEDVLKQLDDTDAGIFVFSPDDTVLIRGIEHTSVRDNVIFELGLFIGRLGRDHSFLVAPRESNLKLPSDLLGINVLHFEADREDGRLDAALGPACAKIRSALELVPPKCQQTPAEFSIPIMERRSMLSGKQRALLEPIEADAHISYEALCALFPNINASELHYRIEQLRLLQFIVVTNANDPESKSDFFSLHPLYAQARRGTQDMRTRIPAFTRQGKA
jgi:Predicted nucleotide-binding protein containing TIR-like domain